MSSACSCVRHKARHSNAGSDVGRCAGGASAPGASAAPQRAERLRWRRDVRVGGGGHQGHPADAAAHQGAAAALAADARDARRRGQVRRGRRQPHLGAALRPAHAQHAAAEQRPRFAASAAPRAQTPAAAAPAATLAAAHAPPSATATAATPAADQCHLAAR